MIRVAVNGFGRIGRNFVRAIMSDHRAGEAITIAAINVGPANRDMIAYMFKYDTLMGTYPGQVTYANNSLTIDNQDIAILAEPDPTLINWKKYNVDWVVESSGKCIRREQAQSHLLAGAKGVLITAPAVDEDISIIFGVNDHLFDKSIHTIVSLGSCTTNAFMPMLAVLISSFGIQRAFMTTIHAYTNTQVLLDVEAKNPRLSRAAPLNIVPASTGASQMIKKIMPEVADLVTTFSFRVPVPKVSLIDLTVITTTSNLTNEIIHAAYKKAMSTTMKGILSITTDPVVSSDFNGSGYSVVLDSLLTKTEQGSV